MPFADIFSGPPSSRTRSTARHHRPSRRPASWFDPSASAQASASASSSDREPARGGSSSSSSTRRPRSTAGGGGGGGAARHDRRRTSSNLGASANRHSAAFSAFAHPFRPFSAAANPTTTNNNNNPTTQSQPPTATSDDAHVAAARSRLTPGADADTLVRGVALAVAAVAFAAVFLNVALHVALVAAAVLVPAWRTFKAVETGPYAAPTVIELLDDDDDDDEIDENYDDSDSGQVEVESNPDEEEEEEEEENGKEEEEVDDPTDRDYRPPEASGDDYRMHGSSYPGSTHDAARRGRQRGAAPRRRSFISASANVGASVTSASAAVHWQKYWTLAGLLFGAHALLARPLLGVLLPGVVYRVGALFVFAWLNGNAGGNAATAYDGVVRPVLLRSERAVDAAAAALADRADSALHRALTAVSSAMAPCVQQLEHAARITQARMEEQKRIRAASRGYFD